MQPPEVVFIALPFVVAFCVSMILAPGLIAALRTRNIGQVISDDGPESHKSKSGTPTMGGLIILAGILAGSLAVTWAFRGDLYAVLAKHNDLLAVLLLVAAYALVGIVDDYLTIKQVRGVRGIASKPKAAIQILLAIAFIVWLSAHRSDGFVPILFVGGAPVLQGVWYWIFAVAFIVGMANSINITDGLDGLASGLVAIAAAAFVACTLLVSKSLADADLTIYAMPSAIAGACLAFLWFNANPAKVFMGDTGSLALGVALPAIAILTHREVLMIVIGFVFVIEGLSTAIQWAVFKYTRITTGTGRRVFRKSPLHHHYELCGWPEQTVVVRFWILGVTSAVIAVAGTTYRIW